MSSSAFPRRAFGYVLLTRGPKHSRARLDRRPGAYSQIRRIGLYAAHHGFGLTAIEWEYRRAASAPGDLETLFALLERCKAHREAEAVILDDIERALRRMPPGQAHELVIELAPWFEVLHDARMNCRLDTITGDRWREVVFATEKHRHDQTVVRQLSRRRKATKPKQTAAARKRSAAERARQADERARAIAALRDELMAGSPDSAPSYASIARAANKRGLRTARGAEWTSFAVSRALARLADTHSD